MDKLYIKNGQWTLRIKHCLINAYNVLLLLFLKFREWLTDMDMVLGKSFKEEKRNTLNIVECAKSKYNKMLEKGYANGAEKGS